MMNKMLTFYIKTEWNQWFLLLPGLQCGMVLPWPVFQSTGKEPRGHRLPLFTSLSHSFGTWRTVVLG